MLQARYTEQGEIVRSLGLNTPERQDDVYFVSIHNFQLA